MFEFQNKEEEKDRIQYKSIDRLSNNSRLYLKNHGGCEIRRAMTGPAWGSRFCLVLAAITIVIANYPRHRNRHLREQLVNSHKVTRNITQLQGALHVAMYKLQIQMQFFFIRIETEHRQNKIS